MLTHLAADVGENLVPVGELDAEHRVGQRFNNSAFHLDDAFFFRHNHFLVGLLVYCVSVIPGALHHAAETVQGINVQA